MGFADNMRIMGNINAVLGSLATYGEMRNNGVPAYQATMGLFGNLGNGLIRNEWAYDMYTHRHNPSGFAINSAYGYGNSVSNALATTAMLYADMPPMMFFGMYSAMPMPMMMPYGVGGFGLFC